MVLTTSHGLGWVEFAYFVEHKWPETDKDLPRVLKSCSPMGFQVSVSREDETYTYLCLRLPRGDLGSDFISAILSVGRQN